jgi:cytoskeletal protein CcmA (bactofilin family)
MVMTKHSEDSVIITGSGKIDGGVYDVIKIMGAGRVNGDIEANSVNTAGSASFSGNINVLNMKTAGSCRVGESVTAGNFKTAGSCTVEGDVRATEFSCSGSQRIGNDLIAGNIKISGSCQVGNDVEADTFNCKGRFHIGGLLTADEIKIQLGHGSKGCKANEIGGERIQVRSGGKFLDWQADDLERKLGSVGYKLEEGLSGLRDRFGIEIDLGDIDKFVEDMVKFGEKMKTNIDIQFGEGEQPSILEVDTIEGDEIYLENTKADIVRGKHVTIGHGCRIERVEYSEELIIEEDAHVGEQEKV